MLTKELEILRMIEELYHGDTTEQDMLDFAEKNQTKVQAWREAFEEYPLYEVTKAINHFYVKKSSKTRPNIAQLTAILQENNATKEIQTKQAVSITPSLAIQYVNQDEVDGNMRWFVPDYINVEKLIRQDRWYFVQNIYKPTLDEFHRCLEYYCEDLTGKKQRFYSRNDILQMTDEQQQALLEESRETMRNFKPWRLN